LENGERRRIYITGLSVALNNLQKNKQLCSLSIPGEKGSFYGLNEWFDHDGKLPLPAFFKSSKLKPVGAQKIQRKSADFRYSI
jgi:hypothetical protein